MTMERKPWGIRPGDPTKMGTSRTADGYNFAIQVSGSEPIELIFYKKGSSEPEQIIRIPENCRVGNVYAVTVAKHGLSLYDYEYRQGEKILNDQCARVVCRETCFGEKVKQPEQVRYRVLKDAEAAPSLAYIPYEDMIVYKVHVRGYTMQKNSRVRKKGTFLGLQEKIPYWKELGVTSIELMPAYDFEEYPRKQEKRSKYQAPDLEPDKLNYWGYTKGYYFAPKASYCAGKYAEQEVKDFVSKLHQEGMECLMDFYFPQEIPPSLVLEVLRFWKIEYKMDGFVLLGEGAWIELIARDEILADSKLICPGYDMNHLCGGEGPKLRRMGEYNSGFQDVMRRFLKGDEEQVNSFQFFAKQNPSTHGVIHYLANHDGFTLADLVSYDYRHNEENGENNRDGSSYNYSWNCGVEGDSKKTAVLELRKKQMRNSVLLLMLSQGTPLIYGGDEFGNSQKGNNNAYCQDNEIGWVDWSKSKKFAGFTKFVQDVIRFRQAHPILHMPYELRPTDYKSLGWPEISYHSERAWFSDTESSSRQTGILYCGPYAENENGTADDFIYIVYNMYWTEKTFALPDLPEGMKWHLAVDSGRKSEEAVLPLGEEELVPEKKSLKVKGRTILVLLGKRG